MFWKRGTAVDEKAEAALNSVLAALLLTGLKIVVGFATGSLGILAEAAHSALDVVAALLTFLAVRIAVRPADRGHPYGHGKVENLSALIETLLLLATCVWIVNEAVERLWFKQAAVEVTIWSFGVMAISIVVDVSRSRMLYRVAKKHGSQAIEADALHFSTDIWSSAVVILGLICVQVSYWRPHLVFLLKADALAALIVASIVVFVSLRLGYRTIQALLDAAPEGLEKRLIETVERVPGVLNCHSVRLRASGPQLFADIHILVDGACTLRDAHHLTEVVEEAIRQIIPNGDVTVHPEPAPDRESGPKT
jgi:cation diffusion facilitator family transporter